MHIFNPEISDEIGRIRVSQLKDSGADLIVSACPSCEEGLIFNGAGECQNIGEILLRSLQA
jgi:Fe-S oxidoreductase